MLFFEELKRRNVFRVAIGYAVSTWLLAQIADLVLDNIGAPPWVMQTFMLFLVLGFPVALFFSWAYEVTPEGIKRESKVDRSQSITQFTGKKIDRAIVAVLVIALAYFIFDEYFIDPAREAAHAEAIAERVPQEKSDEEVVLPADASTADADSIDQSIAVLPFVNMSSDEEQEYFSDGLTEELLNVLARGKEMRVIGRTSSFQFKGKNEDLREIGRKLNVSHILEGSVRRAGDKVRITAQLIDSDDGAHLWSMSFDRTLDDIFAVQDEIANAVVQSLQVELSGESLTPVLRHNAAAYDLYLKGLRARHLPGPENMQEALAYFERSLELDPELAVSWQQQAAVYSAMTMAGMLPTSEGMRLAKDAVNRALEVDPTLANGYGVLGFIRTNFDRDWKGAEEAYARALEIDPNNADALNGAGILAAALGNHAAAVDLNARSIEVDPLNIRALHNKAFIHYLGRDFESAETAMLDAIEFAGGNYIYAHTVLSLILVAQERNEEALAATEKELGEPWRLAAQSIVNHALGREEESAAAIQQLIDKYSDRIALPIAGCYAFRGDADKAVEWLNRAYAQGDPQLSLTRVHPVHDKLQDDPRFQELLRKLGLM